MPAPEPLDSVRIAVEAALDKKAFQLVCLEVSELTSFADYFVICSAASDRQVGAVVDEIQQRLRQRGCRPLHVEGEGSTGWVLVDFGDFIVHVFTEDRRSYYGLDGLWGDAPRVGAETLSAPQHDPPGAS